MIRWFLLALALAAVACGEPQTDAEIRASMSAAERADWDWWGPELREQYREGSPEDRARLHAVTAVLRRAFEGLRRAAELSS